VTVARPVVDDEMRRYYDQRAREYDDWWLGRGLFAERDRPGWDDEVAQIISVIGPRARADARRGLRHGVPHAAPAR
jgi:hypothetical protein